MRSKSEIERERERERSRDREREREMLRETERSRVRDGDRIFGVSVPVELVNQTKPRRSSDREARGPQFEDPRERTGVLVA
jgi:hypothetical protein